MTRPGVRVRFAPSPTGPLHLGNARTALFNWLVARAGSGTLVLRIEDTDTERSLEGAEAAILADLAWLGLDWDEGPDVGGPFGPYRQSERGERYRHAATRLLESGLAFRCFCGEKPAGDAERPAAEVPSFGYPGTCSRLSAAESDGRAARGDPFAVRFAIRSARARGPGFSVSFRDRLRGGLSFSTAELGDPVIVRRDGRPTYNFAVVVDDAAMRLDTIIRGDDHLSNTPRQVLLFRALGERVPEYVHLPMVRGSDGERLSKRHGALSVAELREVGYARDAVLNALALLGWSPGGDRVLVGRDEMVREFEIDRVLRSPAVFDPGKLDWISGQYIQRLPPDALAGEVGRSLERAGLLPSKLPAGGAEWVAEVAETLRGGIVRFDRAPERCAGLFAGGGRPSDGEAEAVLLAPGALGAVRRLAEIAREAPPDSPRAWRELADRLAGETGLRGRRLFRPVRVALTGRVSGPDLDRLVPLIARGSRVLPERIAPVHERAERTADAMAAGGPSAR